MSIRIVMTHPAAIDSTAHGAVEQGNKVSAPAVLLRLPTAEDGIRLHRLVAACAPLDPNSVYCNLLQATHFAATCVAAERMSDPATDPLTTTGQPQTNQPLMGFISAYQPPQQPETLFVWQVAVAPEGRGCGLAKRMLQAILQRETCRAVRYLETTITRDNQASWALFRSLARDLGAPLQDRLYFDRDQHFAGQHDSEYLVRIGPLTLQSSAAPCTAQ